MTTHVPGFGHGHDHDHDHDHDDETDAFGGDTPFFDVPDVEIVRDYTALLKYYDNDNLRWNGQTEVGTAAVVTYKFTNKYDLPSLDQYNPYNATQYWAYNETQQEYFRQALQEYSDVSGVLFVEVRGEAMINAFGADVAGVGGWANYANSNELQTSEGYFVNGWKDMAPGEYGYQILLHELGHSLGLSHPHDGDRRQLAEDVDTQENTVMTYNIKFDPSKGGWANDLGVFDKQAMQHLYGSADQVEGWKLGFNSRNMVSITASDRAETVLATGQATQVNAKGGDDLVYGRESNDWLGGGDDNDTIYGAAGNDTIAGGNGNDTIWGDLETHQYISGNDKIYGGRGNDLIYGGLGDDKIYGGPGSDTLDGGDGNDMVRGFFGHESIIGGNGNDFLSGYSGNDTIEGGQGDDRVQGGTGRDLLYAGNGDDEVIGGRDDDFMSGGNGADTLNGELGDDTMIGGDGADRMIGGEGADVFQFDSADSFETNTIADFEDGIDLIEISGTGLSFGQLVITEDVEGSGSVVSYSNWWDLRIENVSTDLLDASDFAFI